MIFLSLIPDLRINSVVYYIWTAFLGLGKGKLLILKKKNSFLVKLDGIYRKTRRKALQRKSSKMKKLILESMVSCARSYNLEVKEPGF